MEFVSKVLGSSNIADGLKVPLSLPRNLPDGVRYHTIYIVSQVKQSAFFTSSKFITAPLFTPTFSTSMVKSENRVRLIVQHKGEV